MPLRRWIVVSVLGCGSSAPPLESPREGSYLQWVQASVDASAAPESVAELDAGRVPASSARQCGRSPLLDGGLPPFAAAFGDGGTGVPLEMDGAVADLPDGGSSWPGVVGGTPLFMERPRRISGAQSPVYTREAAKHRVQGTFIAKCVITEEGDLIDCCVVKGLPYMEEAVLAAIQTWKYTPVKFRGKPVRVQYTLKVNLLPPDEAKPPPP